jgi:ATP-dependent Clp protease ATP-binding subunit ClpC
VSDDYAERLTSRAKKVLQLAHQKATLLRHEYVGTLHILFGLSAEANGLIAKHLHGLGLTPEFLHEALSTEMPYHSERKVSRPLPFSPTARHALVKAAEEAKGLNHHYLGTEHMLLGILQHDLVSEFLSRVDQDANDIRKSVFQILSCDDPSPNQTQ